MTTDTDFYAIPGPITDMASIDSAALSGLPDSEIGLCSISKGLIVHEFLVSAYGLDDISDRLEELESRTTAEMVSTITGLDSRPLAEPRPASARMIGNCRHFTVLTCALLRRIGIPVRARAGFSGYFDDTWVDHWIVERWDPNEGTWLRTDAQLDDTMRGIFDIDFDPLHLPEDRFLTGSEAWRRYREDSEDPQRFGIQDMRGPWFIASNVVRDLAALNKVEAHVWDTWGVIDELAFRDLTPDEVDLIDRIAEAVNSGSHEAVTAAFRENGIAVPSTVTSNRFQRQVEMPQSVDV